MTFDIVLKILLMFSVLTCAGLSASLILTGEIPFWKCVRAAVASALLGATIFRDLPESENWMESIDVLVRFAVLPWLMMEFMAFGAYHAAVVRERADLKREAPPPRSRFSQSMRRLFKELAEDD